ncbi:hypothetical protein SAMN04488544_1515 [Microlunatus sagamiharensis]|uniref:Uncharacterized protein n=2 Tax=Microlunatus sagamiharensis TaxID=546874 RepID=A0A1H2M716_9ACTN|nr:hypothetical protein SAMN04488544_1515 [Microlunatus sagamiharensis]
MPRPDDLARAPLWELYVNVQLVQASLARLPVHLLALGVEIDRLEVVLRFQLSELADTDLEDIEEIQQDLDELTGFLLEIDRVVEVQTERDISGPANIWWVYLDRGSDAEVGTEDNAP